MTAHGSALEEAARDEDGGVRSQAILALGTIGRSTPASVQVVLSGFQDADPLVRAAAVVSMGRWGEPSEAILSSLAPLLEDANDQVKVEAIKVLPKLAGATPAVIDGLCRRLLEDDSALVQAHAALALGKLGPDGRGRGRAVAPRRPDRGSQRARTGHAGDRHDPAAGNDAGLCRRPQRCLRRHPHQWPPRAG